MIAIANKSAKPDTTTWQEEFLEMMPAIEKHARFEFRNLDEDKKEEAVSEVVANAMCAFRRLYERGELQRVFASALARFAIKQFHDGRRVGTRQCSRDIYSRRAQNGGRFRVRSFADASPSGVDLMECLIDERRTSVPDQAAFRIDFPAWLTSQTKRDQRVVEKLSQRYTTSEVASEFQISPGRVSQLRNELADSWREFSSTTPSKPGNDHKQYNQQQHDIKELCNA